MAKYTRRRQGQVRQEKDTHLILCEGDSEKIYFERLKQKLNLSIIVPVRKAKHTNPKGIVDVAKLALKKDQCDYVYCVFDLEGNADPTRVQEIQTIEAQMQQRSWNKNVGIYSSNPSFEMWLILHFYFTDRPFKNSLEVEKMLKECNGMSNYQKTNYDLELLFKKQNDACKFAKQLDEKNKGSFLENPSTKVHLLVELLKKYSCSRIT